MLLRRIYHKGLAHASYLIGCEHTQRALVIDPNRDINRYLDVAEQAHVQIIAVIETHIHADFISGARELAQRAKARLYVSGCGPQEWRYRYDHEPNVQLLHDNSSFEIGSILVHVWHTPGHTPEHISLLIEDRQQEGTLVGAFTGDFLFVGDVGRPDLLNHGDPQLAERSSREMFHSLQRMRQLPEWIQIWPAHSAGSLCGKSLGDLPQSTLGYELRTNWAFQTQHEQQFIEQLLDEQPEVPPYFEVMKQRNCEGPMLLRDLPPLRGSNQDDLEAMLKQAIVLDTRTPTAFATQHIPGTLNLPDGESLLIWAGWLIPNHCELGLIGDPDHVADLADELRLIGLNTISAYWTTEIINSWKQEHPVGRINRVTAQVGRSLIEHQQILVIDVRKPDEYADGHIPQSINLPLQHLRENLQRIPRNRPLMVYCQRGMRSSAAASLISPLTEQPIYLMLGGIESWQAAGGALQQPRKYQ